MGKYLITTAIDYTNDVIHLGHAYQKIVADVLARFRRSQGHPVFYVTGTDEHGQNIEKAAAKNNQDPQAWCNEISAKNREQLDSLHISYDRFIRTTDPDHEETSLWFYKKVLENGDIYEGSYNGYYCESCEAYKTIRELKNGHCEFHPTLEPKRIAEKNFFFRWSKYADFLKSYIKEHPSFILPVARRAEMLSFLKQGLEDIPVTRQNINWGFKAPNDATQTIYVWFDALINYYTAAKKVGFWDTGTTIIHVLGKDNTRWHTLLWPAMLKSAGLRLPDVTLNHGFLTLEGKKISKTLGNIIRPTELTEKYGSDAVRYYLLRYGPLFDDADISIKKLEEAYTSDLANGLGNHVSRVLGLTEKLTQGRVPKKTKADPEPHPLLEAAKKVWRQRDEALEKFDLPQALTAIGNYLKEADGYINEAKPWSLNPEQDIDIINYIITGLLEGLHQLAFQISPFLPETSQKIGEALGDKKLLTATPLIKERSTHLRPGTSLQTGLKLFPRLDSL